MGGDALCAKKTWPHLSSTNALFSILIIPHLWPAGVSRVETMGSKHSKTSRRGYAASSQHETVRTTATSTNSSANPPADNDPRVDCVPWTAGGDLPVKALPLTENHYSQVDHTLNAAVWDLYMLPQTIDDVTYEQTALQTLKA